MAGFTTPQKKVSLNEIITKAVKDKVDEPVILDEIRKIVDLKLYIENERDRNENTPLHLSCRYNFPAVANFLISNSVADINAITKTKQTALMHACINKMDDIIELLLTHNVNVMLQDEDGLYALAYSCIYGNEDISLKIMKKTGHVIFNDVFVVNNTSFTLLMVVCQREFERILGELLKHRLNAHFMNNEKMTAISYALFSGNEKMTLKLLEKTNSHYYSQVFEYSKTQYTYFSAAARLKMFYVVEFLVISQQSASKDLINLHYVNKSGLHFLDYFFVKSHEHVKSKLSELIDRVPQDKKKESEELVNKYDNMALDICRLYKYDDLLISLNKKNNVLIYACKNGFKKTILYILTEIKQTPAKYASFFNMQNADKNTALAILLETSSNWVFTEPLRKNILRECRPFYRVVDHTTKDNDDRNIMMYAALKGHFEFVLELIDASKEAESELIELGGHNDDCLMHFIYNYFIEEYGAVNIINQSVFEEYKKKSREAKRLCEKIVELYPELLIYKNKENITSLMIFSILWDAEDLMKMSVKSGTDINAIDQKKLNALVYSCFFKNRNAIYLLSLDNIDYSSNNISESPFSISCFSNDETVALEFLKKPDIDVKYQDQVGNTPLTNACLSGLENVALKIIERNPKTIYAITQHYLRPYHFSIMSKSQQVFDKIEEIHRQMYPETDNEDKNMENSFKRGAMFYYNEKDIIFNTTAQIDESIRSYLEESPDNICFEILNDTKDDPEQKKIYGLTTRKEIVDALDYSTSTNTYFYGCKKAMHDFMDHYYSNDPDKNAIADANIDTDKEYIYMLPVAGINGLLNPELLNLLVLDVNKHQYFGLIENDKDSYESIINRLVIVSTNYYSTSTTHCEAMAKPVVYSCFPMMPDPSKKRKRSDSLSLNSLTLSPKPVLPKLPQDMAKISYQDKIYEIKVQPTTTFTQLKKIAIETLADDGKIAREIADSADAMDNIKIRFLYFGKLYTVDKNGEQFINELPNFDNNIAFNTLVHITKPSLAKGGKTRKQGRPLRKRNRKTARR